LTCAFSAALASVAPAPPAMAYIIGPIPPGHKVYGGVDFDGYCRDRGFDGARTVNWTAGGWRCTPKADSVLKPQDIDADDACNHTWGVQDAEAVFPNWNDPYSIKCIQK
jgi:hypothetical protein